jgi:hypothetical protein
MFYLVKVSQIARATSGRLQTKFYDTYDDFIFPIVILPHLSTNITVAPEYRIYISHSYVILEFVPNAENFWTELGC